MASDIAQDRSILRGVEDTSSSTLVGRCQTDDDILQEIEFNMQKYHKHNQL